MMLQGLLQPLMSYGHCFSTCSHRPSKKVHPCNSLFQQQIGRPHSPFQWQRRSCVVRAEDKGTTETTKEELPPWIRSERERKLQSEEGSDLPFPVYLIGSALVAIAAVGSIFEYAGRNALFGIVKPDNPLWAPVLLFFAITGLPSAGFLFIKAINAANKDAERQDKIDGY